MLMLRLIWGLVVVGVRGGAWWDMLMGEVGLGRVYAAGELLWCLKEMLLVVAGVAAVLMLLSLLVELDGDVRGEVDDAADVGDKEDVDDGKPGSGNKEGDLV